MYLCNAINSLIKLRTQKMQLKEYRDTIATLANETPATQNGKIVTQAALALAAKIDILIAEIESPTQLTETEQMLLIVNQHIQSKDGKNILDGKAFAGDIPPSVKWEFYHKITQSAPAIEQARIEPAAVTAEPTEEKKSLSPTAAVNLDSEIEKYDNAVVNSIMKADAYIKSSLSAKSVEKAKAVVSNAALMSLARAADLVSPDEINLKDANGLGNITRKELAIRVYNHYHQNKQETTDEAANDEAGTENATI